MRFVPEESNEAAWRILEGYTGVFRKFYIGVSRRTTKKRASRNVIDKMNTIFLNDLLLEIWTEICFIPRTKLWTIVICSSLHKCTNVLLFVRGKS